MKMQKRLTIAEYEFPIEIIQEDDYFLAKCSKWADCYAQGDSLEEAINEISYVASSLIELYKEEGLKVPLKLKNIREEKRPLIKFNFPLVVSTT